MKHHIYYIQQLGYFSFTDTTFSNKGCLSCEQKCVFKFKSAQEVKLEVPAKIVDLLDNDGSLMKDFIYGQTQDCVCILNVEMNITTV